MIEYRHITEAQAKEVKWLKTPCVNVASGANFIGAFDGIKLIGVVAYKMSRGTIKLCSDMVQPQYRNRGIYSKLFEMRARDISSIQHIKEVAYCTKHSLRMYLAHGFAISKQFKNTTKVEK